MNISDSEKQLEQDVKLEPHIKTPAKFSLFNRITVIITIIISAFAITIPLYVDYVKTNRRIALEFLSRTDLITEDNKIEGMSVLFRSEEVNQLTKLTYRFINKGRTEILKKNIKIPLTIKLGKAKLVTSVIEEAKPTYLEKQITFEYDKAENNIKVNFDDLKKNESFRFSLFIDGEISDPLNAYIRIQNFDKLDLNNLFGEFEAKTQEKKNIMQRNTWIMAFIYPFLLFCLLCTFISLKRVLLQKAFTNKYHGVYNFDKKSFEQLRKFAESELNFLFSSDKREIMEIFEEDSTDAEAKKQKLIYNIESKIKERSSLYALIPFIIIDLVLGYLIAMRYLNL